MHRVIACVVAALAASALGQLTPPTGPIKSTMKTLHEIEPSTPIGHDTTPGDATAEFVISYAGHYHLTDLATSSDKNVIRVRSSGVTIDLRGHKILPLINGKSGIVSTQDAGLVVVRNGEVGGNADWPAIDLSLGSHSIVENIRVTEGAPAIAMGTHAIVRNTTVREARGTGIIVGRSSLVESCIVDGSSVEDSIGISTGEVCIVRDSTVTGFDFAGIAAGPGTRVADCTASGCRFTGFHGVEGAMFSGCTSRENHLYGFYFMSSVRARDCTALDNGASGFHAFQACVLTDCISSSNSQHGYMTVGNLNRFTGNTALNNETHGFSIPTHKNVLTNNTAGGHGGPWNFWVNESSKNYYAGKVDLNNLDHALKNYPGD